MDEGQVDRADQLLVLAQHEVLLDERLEQLVDRDDDSRDGEREPPRALARGAHPAISPTMIPWRMNSTKVATIGLRSKAIPPPPTVGMKRRKILR